MLINVLAESLFVRHIRARMHVRSSCLHKLFVSRHIINTGRNKCICLLGRYEARQWFRERGLRVQISRI